MTPGPKQEPDLPDARDGSRAPALPHRYQPPRIVKKRSVSRATLFSGSGPDGGGVVSA
ncbi:MAG: hypothetical protein WB493_05420 [Anaeromyxobacteraceae bacterium]